MCLNQSSYTDRKKEHKEMYSLNLIQHFFSGNWVEATCSNCCYRSRCISLPLIGCLCLLEEYQSVAELERDPFILYNVLLCIQKDDWTNREGDKSCSISGLRVWRVRVGVKYTFQKQERPQVNIYPHKNTQTFTYTHTHTHNHPNTCSGLAAMGNRSSQNSHCFLVNY